MYTHMQAAHCITRLCSIGTTGASVLDTWDVPASTTSWAVHEGGRTRAHSDGQILKIYENYIYLEKSLGIYYRLGCSQVMPTPPL